MRTKKTANQQRLQKKLKTIKSKDQLFQIFKQLSLQKETLVSDLQMIKKKIKLLKEKYKTQLQFHDFKKDLTPQEQQLQAFKEELNDKNKILHQLKKRKQFDLHKDTNHELGSQLKKMIDQISKIQKEKNSEHKKLHDALREKQKLQITLSNSVHQGQGNVSEISKLQQQNKALRKQILAQKQKGYAKQYESAKVVNNIYATKKRIAKSQSTILPKISSQQIVQINPHQQEKLKNQVIKLKGQMSTVQFLQIKTQSEQKQKYLEYINKNKELLEVQKQYERIKTKLETQLNKYKAKWQNYQKKIEQSNKQKKQTKDYSTQILQYKQLGVQPLRRDFAGIIGNKVRFDDRFFLQKNKKAKIKGFIIYQNDAASNGKGSIVGIRALYNDIQANSKNYPPLPGNYLSKCKQFRTEVTEDDFIKLFKIKYNTLQTRITKIEVRSNKNNKYEFGEKKPFGEVSINETVYGFDIGIKQYPVCLFGSYINSKGHWYLESIGVEINQFN